MGEFPSSELESDLNTRLGPAYRGHKTLQLDFHAILLRLQLHFPSHSLYIRNMSQVRQPQAALTIIDIFSELTRLERRCLIASTHRETMPSLQVVLRLFYRAVTRLAHESINQRQVHVEQSAACAFTQITVKLPRLLQKRPLDPDNLPTMLEC